MDPQLNIYCQAALSAFELSLQGDLDREFWLAELDEFTTAVFA